MQILISVALDWACGGDSIATNPDKDQNNFAASYYLSERNWSNCHDPGAHVNSLRIAR
jgi:hypothetical protein